MITYEYTTNIVSTRYLAIDYILCTKMRTRTVHNALFI